MLLRDNTAVHHTSNIPTVIVADGNFTITNNDSDILDKISVSSFAKIPRASFNKIKKLVE